MPTPTAPVRRRRISADQALALWREYRATGDERVRNRLVMTYAPLVRYIVYRKVRELPAGCEADDLVACGLEALIAAIDRYDPDRGATLEQFAWARIHGAVLDELRRQDWAPRSLRRWTREIARARERFVATTGRAPSREELAGSLAIPVDELRRKEAEIALADLASLNALVASEGDSAVERLETVAAHDDRFDPHTAAAARQARERFRRAFAELPERERQVAVLLYAGNLTLREIGDLLGVSESRACQIHARLKKGLRARLADEGPLFGAAAYWPVVRGPRGRCCCRPCRPPPRGRPCAVRRTSPIA